MDSTLQPPPLLWDMGQSDSMLDDLEQPPPAPHEDLYGASPVHL